MIKYRQCFVLFFFCFSISLLSYAFDPDKDLLIADFEGKDFGSWTIQGEAFAKGPALTGVDGFEGQGFAGSQLNGYRSEGTLTSAHFEIEKPYLNFLLAGGDTGPLYVALLLNRKELRTAIPVSLDRMKWTTWDVESLMGQTVQVQIIDDKSGHPDGYLFVDTIYQSDRPRMSPSATRSLNEEILTAYPFNPDRSQVPGLGVWRQGSEINVSAVFPELPGFTCDSWCYEMPDCELVGASAREGGSVELVHKIKRGKHAFRFLTRVIPTPGSIEFLVKPVVDPAEGESCPDILPVPNLCFQLRRAEGFKSDRSGEVNDKYPEFVGRCFIYTDQGRTFLLDTDRQKIPVKVPTTLENNPPWVQNYVGAWKEPPEADPQAWAGTSKTRYTVPVIGTVSRDGKYLVALAEDSADLMCQAWHDCLHSHPKWQPVDAVPVEQTWRLKVYVMENDSTRLLRRIEQDFPRLHDLGER